MGMLEGKRALILGVASNRSIAWGIARAMRREGAELAFTYVGERFKDRITEFATEFDSKLVFDITGPDHARAHVLSLTPLKGVLRDYLMICDSYYEALRGSSPSQIESVDMGRRGLHNEGAETLKARLDGKIDMDHETSRRLFTLVCALYRR